MGKPGQTGVMRLWLAFGHAGRGLAAALRHELAFRVEVATAVVALPAAFLLGSTPAERGLLAAVSLLVPLVEVVNAAIEATIDRIGPERHPLSGRAKDLGSAAVLLSLVLAAVTWGAVLFG